MTPPTAPNQRWSLDFVHHQLADGRRFRVFTVVDDFTRKSIVLRVGTSLPSSCVAEALQQAMQTDGASWSATRVRVHESRLPEVGAPLRIDVQHIQPGKPVQNAFCESFNGSFRDECLNMTWFALLQEPRRRI